MELDRLKKIIFKNKKGKYLVVSIFNNYIDFKYGNE